MVALSELDLNNYTPIMRYRQKATIGFNNITNQAEKPLIYTDEYGERVKSKITHSNKSMTETEITGIITGHKNGLSISDLAHKFNCHRNTVINHLRKHGIEVTNSKISPEHSVEILQLYKNRLNVSEIAERLNISSSAILNHLHKQGVKIRGRWG